jgi:hypothetical protein
MLTARGRADIGSHADAFNTADGGLEERAGVGEGLALFG